MNEQTRTQIEHLLATARVSLQRSASFDADVAELRGAVGNLLEAVHGLSLVVAAQAKQLEMLASLTQARQVVKPAAQGILRSES